MNAWFVARNVHPLVETSQGWRILIYAWNGAGWGEVKENCELNLDGESTPSLGFRF